MIPDVTRQTVPVTRSSGAPPWGDAPRPPNVPGRATLACGDVAARTPGQADGAAPAGDPGLPPWGGAPTPEDIAAARQLALAVLAELATGPAATGIAGHLDPAGGGGDSPFTPDPEWHNERDGDL